jgi:soluble epoxide hydrolase / lipid-phosphate phosphatase
MARLNFLALTLAAFFALGLDAQESTASSFDPYAFKKTFVTCKGVERAGSQQVNVNLKLAYLDINPTAKRTLVLVHGWPSLWTTYRHQISDLGKEYRLIIPENRGFGDSEHPKDLYSSNTMFDVSCVLSPILVCL